MVRWEDQFSVTDLIPSRPAAPGSYMDVDRRRRITREPSVVLELAEVTYDTTDPDFDPKRNYLTGITSGVVVRGVPAAELRQSHAA